MFFQPEELVIVLNTSQKGIESAMLQSYHPELLHYTVLFQYPDKPEPEPILLPTYCLVKHPNVDEPLVIFHVK